VVKLLRRKKKEETRHQHYAFANRLLPSVFFRDPAQFMEILRREKQAFLLYLWEKAGRIVGERHKLAHDSWSCEFVTLEDSVSMTIITFPEPGAMTEPFFVAAVFRPAEPGSELEEIARWFALEYTTPLQPVDTKAFFCEWTCDGMHLNMGQHTEITYEAFAAAVRVMLEPEPDL